MKITEYTGLGIETGNNNRVKMKFGVKRTQIIYRDNLTGRFISAKRFKKLSKKRTSKEKIAFV